MLTHTILQSTALSKVLQICTALDQRYATKLKWTSALLPKG